LPTVDGWRFVGKRLAKRWPFKNSAALR